MDSSQRLDYLYKEYVRLSERAEEYIKSTFEDFKLLGAVGATIVLWKPIADVIVLANSKVDYNGLLFLGFLSLLSTLALIAFMNLVKQSYISFLVHNLQDYEKEIKKELNEAENSQVFDFNLRKEGKEFVTAVYRLSFRSFVLVFALTITFIPSIILLYFSVVYAVIYLLLSVVGIVIYLQVFKRMTKQYFSQTNYF